MNAPSPVIRLQAVTLRYGRIPVVDGVDLEIAANRVTTLSGPSGSGKSTLLRTLCRMNDRLPGFSVSGKVEVLGQDVHAPSTDVCDLRRRVGLLFQKPCVFPKSILENVVFGLKYHHPGERARFPELARRALEQAGLWAEVKDRLDAPAVALSQGQQQRLALARTLALEPEILLLDEPTASLDPESSAIIEELAATLKARCSLVWVTHDPAQADRIADRKIAFADGRILPHT
ncbi:MAG: ATP-binding cassette domain-containing protein [Nitrospina sp.]|nr:ATP-binding cassette domain-containing protein [Nitrospina sp.]